MLPKRFLVLLTSLVALAACSSDPAGTSTTHAKLPGPDPKLLVLETDPGGLDPVAGAPFALKCRTFLPPAADAAPGTLGAEVTLPGPATVTVVDGPADALKIEGSTVTFRKAGPYHVACAVPSVPLLDATPALVHVEPGPPHTVETILPPDKQGQPLVQVIAGTAVDVTCTALDQYDNAIVDGFSLAVDPPGQAAPQGLHFLAHKAGTWQIACQVAGVADTTPAVLVVVADVPRHLFTVLDPGTIEAGHAAGLTCVANDAYGNVVEDFPFALDNDPEVVVKGLYVSCTQAGLHKVQCVPESLAWDLFTLHPATLTVVPGPAKTLDLTPVPAKPVYKDEEKVQFLTAVHDAFSNLRPDDKVDLEVSKPAKGFKKLDDSTIKFNVDGTYTVHGEVIGTTEVQKDLQIVVDGTPPLLTLDSPPWGSTLTGKPSVQLKGTAGDTGAGLKSLKVSKTSSFVDPSQKTAFASAIPCQVDADCKDGGTCGGDPQNLRCSVSPWASQEAAQHGLNAVLADAEDVGGEKVEVTRGFYYSGKYYPTDAATPKGALVPDGMQVFLGKDFLDDGVHDPLHPDDLATIMEIAIGGLDVGSLLPPTLSQGDLEVKLSGTKFGKPHISLAPQAGGISMKIEIPNVYTDIDVKAKQKLGPISFTLKVSGNLTIDKVVVSTNILMSVENGVAKVAVAGSSVDLQNLKVHVDGLAGLLDPLINLILGAYKGQLQNQMVATLNSTIPGLLQGLLQQFALNTTVPLPGLLPGQPAVAIQLVSVLKTLEFTTAGGLLKLDAGFVSQQGTTHKVLGAIGRDGCIGTSQDAFAIDTTQRLQIALHDDVMNQALHAVWYAGALTIPKLTAEQLGLAGGNSPSPLPGFSLDGAVFGIDLFLPPIVETCNQPTPEQVRIQVGDLNASATLKLGDDELKLGLFASVDIGAQIGLAQTATGTQVAVTLDKTPHVMLELVSISKDFQDQKAAFQSIIQKQLNDALAKGVPGLDKLAVDLPSLDLGSLLPGLPAGAKIGLKIKDLKRSGGYTAISALLQ
jgi:hypothetical protein